MKMCRTFRTIVALLLTQILLFESFVAQAQSVYSGSTIFIVPQTTDNTPQNGVIKTPTNNTINNSPNSQPVTQPTSEPIVIVNQGPDPDLYLHEGHGWDRDTSHTECGGLRRDGKPQPRCKLKPANYEGPARGTCPAGTVFDIGQPHGTRPRTRHASSPRPLSATCVQARTPTSKRPSSTPSVAANAGPVRRATTPMCCLMSRRRTNARGRREWTTLAPWNKAKQF